MAKHAADYDLANLYVDPDELKRRGDALLAHAQDVGHSLDNITNTLLALQLGWAGQTADEAKDFGNRWGRVMTELFGTKDHPEQGVLNAIVDGVLTARDAFSKTEDGLVKLFNQFAQDLSNGGGGGTPTSPPPSINDTDLTAITETW